MEERESSIASSTDFYGSDKNPDTPAHGSAHDALPVKRRAEEPDSSPGKRRKLDSPPSLAHPADLSPCAGLPPASESIWAAARNAHPTKPPKPLPGFSELQMWQLVWSKKCQFCGKHNSFAPGEKVWQKGPSATGVRTIWPFGIRACGPCLIERCQTDASLLFSTASALRPGLPFALVTTDQNYIPAYTLQAATTPAGVDIVKYFYKAHVDDITRELEHAQSLGQAAAEEWSKGLDARGRDRMRVAEKWERWEVKYQWWSDHREPKRALSAAPSAASSRRPMTRSPTQQAPSPVTNAMNPVGKYNFVQTNGVAGQPPASTRFRTVPILTMTTTAATTPRPVHPRPPTIPPPVFTPQPIPGVGAYASRGERNLHDANEAKASRKADIERRCQALDPPIPPNVLRHMDSFKAAIQISQPMTDYAWSVLKPRLLAQLPAAQLAEVEHAARASLRAADRRPQESKEVLDREWEEAQRPVREKLGDIADDFIDRDWNHGRAVTFENSPKFAADLLVHVRRVFYAGAAKEDGAMPASTDERPRLVLDNMKWVYDNKLKPLTEQFRKELFLCYGNGCEGNIRFYGFEGVIQHFGAKHTNAFSVGNVVVAWREAEWPEETPFHPDPISVKHAYHSAPAANGYGPSGYNSHHGGYSRAETSTPHVQARLPHASPSPYQQQGGGQYNGPFAPPLAGPHPVPGYDYGQSYNPPLDPYSSYPPLHPRLYGAHAANNGYMTSPAVSNAVVPSAPATAQPHPRSTLEPAVQVGAAETEYRTNLFDKQVSTVIQTVQDLWKQTSGIKDFPNSLRIYVLLHRVISKFQLEFNHEPDLNHFLDALSNHEIPKALKNAPGLSCKACRDDFPLPMPSGFPARPEERRTYTALNLFSHFKSQHLGPQTPGYGIGQPPAHLDWKEKMIELPSDRFISGLIHAPGMDDDKLHMIATVFPNLFPTPLPKIGTIENIGGASPARSVSKEAARPGGTPGIATEESGPSSLASLTTDSPRPPKPTDDGYDPQHPALFGQANHTSRTANRVHAYHSSPPADRRPRYYAEPLYYVQREAFDDGYPGPREYVEVASSPGMIRDVGYPYEDYHGRRPLYREHEPFVGPGREDVVYAHPPDRPHPEEHEPYTVRYLEDNARHPEYRFLREHRSQEPSPTRAKAEADRFLEEFMPVQSSSTEQAPTSRPDSRLHPLDADPEDGSRYSPPPRNMPSLDPGHLRTLGAQPHPAPSTISNGSRYEEHPTGRQVPTPDSAGSSRRTSNLRRRDKYHDHVPSRYYRYMSVARDDPYARGASMSRSQSRRYERYEEQRRRIDQQETPQSIIADREYDAAYSRDHSVDRSHPEDPFYRSTRPAPREFVPAHERPQPYPPARIRYAGAQEDVRGPPPVYVDEYGQPVHEYEIIRVRGDPRPPRAPHSAHPAARYVSERDPNHVQYVPYPYDRQPPHRYDDRPGTYVYYEERERAPPRRPGPGVAPQPEVEPPYEQPPKIKVESAPGPEGP